MSIHVVGTADGHEYLRFDAFDNDPHYHYVRPTLDHNHWIPFKPTDGGDMLDFAIHCLRWRLPEILTQAGGEKVAARLEIAVIDPVINEVEKLAMRRVRNSELAPRA